MAEEIVLLRDEVEQGIIFEIADLHESGVPTPASEGFEQFEMELTDLIFNSPDPAKSYEFALLFLGYLYSEGELCRYKYRDLLLIIDIFNRSFEGGHYCFSTCDEDEREEYAHGIIVSNYLFARFKAYFNLLDSKPVYISAKEEGQTVAKAKKYLHALIKHGRESFMHLRFWLILRQDMQIVLSRQEFAQEFADVDEQIAKFFK